MALYRLRIDIYNGHRWWYNKIDPFGSIHFELQAYQRHPPSMNETEWEQAFDLYKQYPEYQKLNSHFTLEDFKSIYFWEWLHRVIGRVIGLVFILPFVYFLMTKRLSGPTIKKSIVLLILGAFQGFLGWYMVKSGLVDPAGCEPLPIGGPSNNRLYYLCLHLVGRFGPCFS